MTIDPFQRLRESGAIFGTALLVGFIIVVIVADFKAALFFTGSVLATYGLVMFIATLTDVMMSIGDKYKDNEDDESSS